MAHADLAPADAPDGTSRPVRCGQCGTGTFEQEVAKTDSRWGFTQHKTTLLVCTHCSHVATFYDNRVIFFWQVE